MEWSDVIARLNDLPGAFLRQGPNFTAFQNALAVGLYKYTNATEGAVAQMTTAQALGKWLDVFGNARNLPRFSGELDADYLSRMQFLLTTPGGPPNAVLGLFNNMKVAALSLTENFTTTSYSVAVQSYINPTRQAQVAAGLNYVRPAGVPYSITIQTGGLYLNTLNYLGRPRVTGAYLASATTTLPLLAPKNTNNAIAMLPTTYLSDPTLNPSLTA